MSNKNRIDPVIRIRADDATVDCEVSIHASDDDYFAVCFASTRAEALAGALKRFSLHRQWLRKQRTQELTMNGKSLDNDPTLAFSRMLQEDIRAERAAKSLANVASRFMVDEPHNDSAAKVEVAA